MTLEHVFTVVSALAALVCASCCAALLYERRSRTRQPVAVSPATPPAVGIAATSATSGHATKSEALWSSLPASLLPPTTTRGTVEGMEMDLDKGGVVRRARVAAMNDEHRELVLVVNAQKWDALSIAARQQAAIAARSTWAAKVCASGPDIAYVTIVTDGGTMVAQADPRNIRVA